MRNKKITLLAVFLVTLAIAASVHALEPTESHDADSMWMEPSTIDISGVSVGYKFNVTVWANASQETKGWQIWLYYTKGYINASRAGYTAGAKSEFFEIITCVSPKPSLKPNYNDTHSRVDAGEGWIMGPYREPGYGSLCWIEFEVLDVPPAETTITLDIKYAYEALTPPQTCLFGSDSQPIFPLDVYNTAVIPELTILAMLALLAFATPTVLYACKKKR